MKMKKKTNPTTQQTPKQTNQSIHNYLVKVSDTRVEYYFTQGSVSKSLLESELPSPKGAGKGKASTQRQHKKYWRKGGVLIVF